jgi:hypothetical protein
VLIHIGLEVMLKDPISKEKVGITMICALNGSKVGENTIPIDYVAIQVKEVYMPNVISSFVHQMTNPRETQVEIVLGVIVLIWSS